MRSITLVSLLVLWSGVSANSLPGTGDDQGETVIYRDTWGIPHIYADNDLAGFYAQGYAMAEDRPEQLLLNLLAAMGGLAEVAGPAAAASDLRSHLFDHYGTAQRNWHQLSPQSREVFDAFVRGVNRFYAEHPQDKPRWWRHGDVDKYMAVAFGRLFLYNWSIDEAYGDLRRGGIEPGYDAPSRGSNQFAVSAARSAEGAPILAIDPHLAWFGPSRFWEFRIHAGELHGSGVTLPGVPYIGLGHNADVAWAMTTGGPDTADVYELAVNPDDPGQYHYNGKWVDFEVREVTIKMRGEADRSHRLEYAQQGPVIARRDGKAYAAAMAYLDVVNTTDAWHSLNYGKDYKAAVEGLATLTVFPQNVMVADTSGNIYYQRTGRVPKRKPGYDWSRPVDGSSDASAWLGLHDAKDHLQVLNPPQGYMQNCNIPPDAMMPDSPFKLEEHPDYIFSGPGYGSARSGWTNQRGARAIELLAADDSVTVEEAMAIINDVRPHGVDRWLGALRDASEAFRRQHAGDRTYERAMKDLLSWDGRVARDSTGALKYFYWREQLARDLSERRLRSMTRAIDDWYAVVENRPAKHVVLDDAALSAMVSAFARGMARLLAERGSLDATYGDRFRVGRDERSWPVGGGGRHGTRTLRSMGYGGQRDDGTNWGQSGQTSTQVVLLTKPIQSWIYIPVGQSDRPDSPHYTDQAEKLFSRRQFKPSWWLPEDLADHIESRTVLDNSP